MVDKLRRVVYLLIKKMMLALHAIYVIIDASEQRGLLHKIYVSFSWPLLHIEYKVGHFYSEKMRNMLKLLQRLTTNSIRREVTAAKWFTEMFVVSNYWVHVLEGGGKLLCIFFFWRQYRALIYLQICCSMRK